MEQLIPFLIMCLISGIIFIAYIKTSRKLNKLKEEKMNVESELKVIQGLDKGYEDKYKVVVSEILKTQNETFKTEATQPVLETMSSLKENINNLQVQTAKYEEKFTANMENMSETTKNMMQETSVLSDVLKNSSKRGRYAEIEIERIFKMSNMIKGIHYTTQQTNEAGQRPDFTVKLSDDKHIIIDSKAPLDALRESYEIDDESEKATALKKHVLAVKNHIKDLEKRDYTKNNMSTLEYVVMVVPEYALLPALEQENKLVEYALEKHVILATHSTLMVLLRTVELMWKQNELSSSVKEIGELTTEVYSQIHEFTTHYQKTGKELEDAVKSYNSGVNSLHNKVIPDTKKLAELSSSTKKLPEITMIDKAVKQLPEI